VIFFFFFPRNAENPARGTGVPRGSEVLGFFPGLIIIINGRRITRWLRVFRFFEGFILKI
jgi:hypothetical protein